MYRCVMLVVLMAAASLAFLQHRGGGSGARFWSSSLSAASKRGLDEVSLGAPMGRPGSGEYVTAGGAVKITSTVSALADPTSEVDRLVSLIDDNKGVLLTSSYEFPGRYARWTVGFVAPALQIEGRGLDFKIQALNDRGAVIAAIIRQRLEGEAGLFKLKPQAGSADVEGSVVPSSQYFPEEERSKQPSIFSLIRIVKDLFYSPDIPQLGLYGALGYDVTFQFEPIELRKTRPDDQRDVIMYLPDEIYVVDNQRKDSWKMQYEFSDLRSGASTKGLARAAAAAPYSAADPHTSFTPRDIPKGRYAQDVVVSKEEFRVGNLFEVVLSQAFRERLAGRPSDTFRRLCRRNPSPYGFFMNLGRLRTPSSSSSS